MPMKNGRWKLCAALALIPMTSCGRGDEASASIAEKDDPETPAIVLSDLYGICADRYFDAIRESESHGDMVKGRMKFDTPGGVRTIELQIGLGYGFAAQSSGTLEIRDGDESREVGVLRGAGSLAYLVPVSRGGDVVEVLVEFPASDSSAEQLARALALSVTPCEVKLLRASAGAS